MPHHCCLEWHWQTWSPVLASWYLFGHLFAQCSSEPQVKQPSLFLSFFLPFLMADAGSTIQTYSPVAQGDDEWLENHSMYCAWWSIIMEDTNHLNILCSSTKIKLSIPVDFVFICCQKTKTHQHTHEYWPQCQPTNRWTNKLKVR